MTQAKTLQSQLMPKQEAYDMKMNILTDLSKQGTPFPWVMDEIAKALDPRRQTEPGLDIGGSAGG